MAEHHDESNPAARVQVQIGGRSYTLRGSRDPEAVRNLAAFVDGKMAEIAERTSTADTTRLAILAALNIADELFRAEAGSRGGATARGCAHQARDSELCRILDAALAV